MITKDELPKALLDLMPPNSSKEATAKIINFLNQRSQASISECQRATGVSYVATRAHLERLVAAGLALEERHGMNRLFILKEID